jgi:phosphotransferase family enzyme
MRRLAGDPRILDRAPRPDASPASRAADSPSLPAADSPSLPAALAALLARERMTATRVLEITSLRGREGPRRTFCIELAGGERVKGRTHREPAVAERMSRWLPPLAAHGYAALRAAHGNATLEDWLAGDPLDPADIASAERAGELLGACHAALPVEVVPARDARLRGFREEARGWVEAIGAAGHVTAARAQRIAAELEARSPDAARWGLYHGDFSPENLVVDASRVRCVDNTTVRPQLLEIDAGFTVNRWPLRGAVRERFLAGYRRRSDAAPFLASEGFWRLAAALRSAAYRVRERTGDVLLPLREIDALVP